MQRFRVTNEYNLLGLPTKAQRTMEKIGKDGKIG